MIVKKLQSTALLARFLPNSSSSCKVPERPWRKGLISPIAHQQSSRSKTPLGRDPFLEGYSRYQPATRPVPDPIARPGLPQLSCFDKVDMTLSRCAICNVSLHSPSIYPCRHIDIFVHLYPCPSVRLFALIQSRGIMILNAHALRFPSWCEKKLQNMIFFSFFQSSSPALEGGQYAPEYCHQLCLPCCLLPWQSAAFCGDARVVAHEPHEMQANRLPFYQEKQAR